jgi:thiamine pyrophosphokinase
MLPVGNESIAIFCYGQMPLNNLSEIIHAVNQCRWVILADGGANHFYELCLEASSKCLKVSAEPICLVGDLDSVSENALTSLMQLYPKLEIIQLNRDKDFTDLEAALKLIKIDLIDKITLFYALGGRVDQMLGNLLCLYRDCYRDKVTIYSPDAKISVKAVSNSLQFYQDKGYSLQIVPKEAKEYSFPENGVYSYEFHQKHILKDLSLLIHCAAHPKNFRIETLNELVFSITPEMSCEFDIEIGKTISLIPIKGPVHGIYTQGLRWSLKNGSLDKNFIGISNIASNKSVTISVEEGALLCIINKEV